MRLRELIDLKAVRFNLLEVDAAKEGLALIESGKVAGFANFEAQLYHWLAGQPNYRKYIVVGEALALEPVALALPRDDIAFKQRVSVAVSHAMIDGHVSSLYQRWFTKPIPPGGITLGIPMNEILRSSLLLPVE